MKIKKNQLINLLIVIIPSILLIITSILLIDDSILFNTGTRNLKELKKIAVISKSDHDVRRRFRSEFVWYPVRENDHIYQKDSIFTGESSSAEISFEDNTKISIAPGSLIVIDGNQLDVQHGTFVGKLGQRADFSVVLNGKQSKIAGDSSSVFKIDVTKGGDTKILALEGDIELKASDKDKGTRLSKNQAIDLTSDGKLSDIVTYDIELISPGANQVIWRKALTFRWKEMAQNKQYVFIMANNPQLKTPLIKESLQTNSFALKTLPAENLIYWQVRSIDKSQKIRISPIFKLVIKENIPPQLTHPQDKALFVKKNMRPQLAWKDATEASSYQLQLARTNSFKPPLVNTTLSTRGWQDLLLTPGTYFWRVKIADADRLDSKWSNPFVFTISSPITAPTLITPAHKAELELPFKKHNIELKWDAPMAQEEAVEEYLIELSQNSSFDNNLLQFKTKSNSITAAVEIDKDYYWRVIAQKRNGEISATSKIHYFETDLLPLLDSPSNLNSSLRYEYFDHHVFHKFSWRPIPQAQSYQIEIANKKERIILKDKITENIYEWNNNEREQFKWRVCAIDEFKRAGEYTSWKKAILPKEPIRTPPPSIVSPQENQLLVQEQMSITLNWFTPDGDRETRIQFADNPNFTPTILDEELDDVFSINTPKLKDGKYYWRLMTINPKRAFSAWSKAYQFEIYKDIGTATLISPKQDQTFYILGKSHKVKLQWDDNKKTDEKVDLVRLKVFNDSVDNAQALLVNERNPRNPHYFRAPVNNNYCWQVIKSKRGETVFTASRPECFAVKTIPLLPHSTSLYHTHEYRKMGSVVIHNFSWLPVKEAVSYIFELANEQDSILLTKELTNLSFQMIRKNIDEKLKWRVFAIDKYKRRGIPNSWHPITLKKYERKLWAIPAD